MAYAFDSHSYLMPGFDIDYQYQIQSNPSPLYSTSSASEFLGEYQFNGNSPQPAEKQRLLGHIRDTKGGDKSNQMQGDGTPSANPAESSSAANKPKRVRTGCLTCRERHLKCELVNLFSAELLLY